MLNFTNTAAAAVLLLIFIFHGRRTRPGSHKGVRGLRAAGLILLGLQAALYFATSLSDRLSHSPGGTIHLVEGIVIALLVALAGVRPLETGIALVACGIISATSPFDLLIPAGPGFSGDPLQPTVLFTAVPQILAGALLLLSCLWKEAPERP